MASPQLSSFSSSLSDHEFSALNTLLLVCTLTVCILTAYLTKIYKYYYFPESAVAISVGLCVGGLVKILSSSSQELAFLSFEPEVFFFLLLPPIIFNAAYSLKKKDFFSNFWTISFFSVFGTVISTFLVGYLVYFIGILGWIDIDTSSPLEALLFGSLISAIDPVATLSVMGNDDLDCNPLLYSLVFGESVLNDAVSIVLFQNFLEYYNTRKAFNGTSIILSFIGITSISIIVGVLSGLSCCLLCKHTKLKNYPDLEIGVIALAAYGSYSLSEAIKLSGIMSLFFCGIVLSHYNIYNVSYTSKVTARTLFQSLGIISEFVVYIYIGMGVFTGKVHPWNILFSLLALIFCIIGRFFNVFPISFISNYFRKEKIPVRMQVVMWFAGLRGAISFALSLNMPGENRGLFISTTLTIVVFTTLICGGLTEPMLNAMKMRDRKGQTSSEGDESRPIEYVSPEESQNSDRSLVNSSVYVPLQSSVTFSRFQRFDREIMKPLFGGSSQMEEKCESEGADAKDELEMILFF